VSVLYAWLRAHPTIVDAGLGAFLGLGAIGSTADAPARALVSLMLVVAVALRRRDPVIAFALGTVGGALQLLTNLQMTATDLAIVVLLYTVAAYRGRRYSLAALAVCIIGGMVATTVWFTPSFSTVNERHHITFVVRWLVVMMVFGGPSVFAWALGDSMRVRRAYYIDLEDRAARLERERDSQARIAVAGERARIARELHDVVAHNVSVMVVQAEGAGYALDRSPETARTALSAIAETGRTALTEMRRLLGVLRNEAEENGYAPQPGVERLGELLTQVRNAGLTVELTVEGVPRPLSASASLTVYRIVQESLTNTRKHGGPAACARVRLHYHDDAVWLRVDDNGRGGRVAEGGSGHGLIGMRERVAMLGGTLHTGTRATGGFEVVATVPYTPVPSRESATVSAGGGEREAGAG
jgi:signal transduction histidine kinase